MMIVILRAAMRYWFAAVGILAASGCAHDGKPKEAVVSDPTRAPSDELLSLGMHFARAGDTVRAEQYLAAALTSGADADAALLPLMKVCIKAGRFEVAAQYAETYLSDVVARREVEMLLSGLYITLHQDDDARRHLERITERYPDHPLAHLLLGRLLRQQGRSLDRADHHFRRYLELAPNGMHAEEARESLLKPVGDAPRLPDLSANTDDGDARERLLFESEKSPS